MTAKERALCLCGGGTTLGYLGNLWGDTDDDRAYYVFLPIGSFCTRDDESSYSRYFDGRWLRVVPLTKIAAYPRSSDPDEVERAYHEAIDRLEVALSDRRVLR